MMGQYLPLVTMLILVLLFVVFSFAASKILAPRRTSEAKEAPYECGIVPTEEPPARFPVRFYLVAMIFIVFDIEIIFIFPYVTAYRQLGAYGFIELVFFAVTVFASFLYLLANGALDWGPIKTLRSTDDQVSAERTAESTIRRVGLEGRDEEVAA